MSSCETGLQNLGASANKKQTSSCVENGVHNYGKNDICNNRKNGKEDDDWVFDVDSNSNSNSTDEGNSGGYDGRCLPDRPERKFLPSQ
jgi:hypothetical protein